MTQNKHLLTTPELASALGENPLTIRNWRRTGIIPHVRLGYRSIRFRPEDVIAALKKRTIREVA